MTENNNKNKRILIIDDDLGVRKAYQQILSPPSTSATDELLNASASLFDNDNVAGPTRESYELTLATRGQEGVELAKEAEEGQKPFALAFIDMKMPGIDGATTARRIWDLDPRIKIVIVTAFSEYTPNDIVNKVGRDDIFYLNKPFNQGEIRQFARALSDQWNLETERTILVEKLEASNQKLKNLNEHLEEKVQEQTSLLVQSEKMATVGLLAAGVAHEINNPAAFIRSNLNSAKRYLDKLIPFLALSERLTAACRNQEEENPPTLAAEIESYRTRHKIDFILDDLPRLTAESLEGIDRISTIVTDLKSFSRVDLAETDHIDINEVLDTTITIIHHQLKYKARIVKDYGDLPKVECFPQKISQVFMNLLVNAGQAISTSKKGVISITTRTRMKGRRHSDSWVEIEIADTGCGIPEENLTRLFDPFFTTKPVGEGTGLGLSIVYNIIKEHGGTIRVTSEAGSGTKFIVNLPVEMYRPGLETEVDNDE